MDTTQILQGVEIFKGLPLKELEAVAELCELQKFKAGDVVFTEKSRGKEIYIIVQGQVAIDKALLDLFKDNKSLGCKVMTNLATMLAAKLRKTNLQLIACFAWE